MCGHTSSMAWSCPLVRNTAMSFDPTATTVLPPSGMSAVFPTFTRWPTGSPSRKRPDVRSLRAVVLYQPGPFARRSEDRMLEVEVRYRTADPAGVIAKLLTWGATLAADRTDADQYFQAPDRDLKATDEAFRLRRI